QVIPGHLPAPHQAHRLAPHRSFDDVADKPGVACIWSSRSTFRQYPLQTQRRRRRKTVLTLLAHALGDLEQLLRAIVGKVDVDGKPGTQARISHEEIIHLV